MATKVISTYVAAGYTLSSAYNVLDITSTGGVGGKGVYAFSPATIYNYGVINNVLTGNAGVNLFAGGSVFNAGEITGDLGVYSYSSGTVDNVGYVNGTRYGVFVGSQGSVTNGDTGVIVSDRNGVDVIGAAAIANYGVINAGSTSGSGVHIGSGTVVNGRVDDTTALIVGEYGVSASGVGGGAATVMNYGTVRGRVLAVDLFKGGSVSNGGATDRDALIQGLSGISISNGVGAVANFGTIRGLSGGGAAISLAAGGNVNNGGLGNRAALIEGGKGVDLGVTGMVANFGTIEGDTGAGIAMRDGAVVNGDFGDTVATIEGYYGVRASASTFVTNFGTIDGLRDAGVRLDGGGAVTNGGAGDRGALIQGAYGVYAVGAAATVSNFGTIRGTRGLGGVHLLAGGLVTNGSLNNTKATIEGYDGLILSGSATATNFGTISGQGDAGGYGVSLNVGEGLTNGAAGHAGALIDGFVGVNAYGGGNTVTNFGTISGAAGVAVRFVVGGDELVVEAGCAFQGAVLGGGGSVEFASGTGTLANLAGGTVTASGSMATTTFSDFDAVIVGVGATFVDKGAVSISAGDYLSAQGTLTIGGAGKASIVNAGEIEVGGISGALTIKGAVTNTGTLASFGGKMTVTAAVTGKGVVQLNGISTIDFAAAFTENVTFETASFATLELGQSQGYTGTITGFSTVGGSMLDLDDIAYVSASEATYSGTSKGGVLTVTDGTHTAHINLKGNYLSSTFVAASDGHGGVIIHDPTRPPATGASPGAFVAAMTRLVADPAAAVHASAEPWRAGVSSLSSPGACAP